jgi:hypothetical protein
VIYDRVAVASTRDTAASIQIKYDPSRRNIASKGGDNRVITPSPEFG